MKTMQEIYENYVNGDRLTNTEVLEGYNFYLQLGQNLRKCGPVFQLAAKEALRIAYELYEFASARKILDIE